MPLAVLGGSPVRTTPFPAWPVRGPQEADALREVLRSDQWGGYHPMVGAFERAFAELHQVPHAVACVNGTVALEVALRAVGVGPGDEVIVPPFTFVASATAVLLCQGAPVFADIDPATLTLSPAAVEALITPRTRAIVAVHFGGHPADLDALTDIARRHGVALVEDAAHAHGARWRGRPVGGWGDVATFSFQAFKLMTAGEGGVVVTHSAELADACWSYCNQGRQRDGGWFEHVRLGTNYRITAFQAAVLQAQLGRLLDQTAVRAANVAYFRERLRQFPAFALADDDGRVDRHPYYLVTLRFRPELCDGVSRDRAIEALQAEGIPVKPTYPYPLYRNPLFRKTSGLLTRHNGWRAPQDYERLALPEAERACHDGVWLAHTLFLGERHDVDDILAAIDKLQRDAARLQPARRTTPA